MVKSRLMPAGSLSIFFAYLPPISVPSAPNENPVRLVTSSMVLRPLI